MNHLAFSCQASVTEQVAVGRLESHPGSMKYLMDDAGLNQSKRTSLSQDGPLLSLSRAWCLHLSRRCYTGARDPPEYHRPLECANLGIQTLLVLRVYGVLQTCNDKNVDLRW